jgi:hypothetical protein
MLPRRRTAGLLVDELPDETVVYDKTCYKVHCLNRVATFVWNHCDGRTSGAEMARLLGAELNCSADLAAVRLIVEQLAELHLLVERPARPAGVVRRSRRAAAKQLAVLGFTGLVLTIPVPTAMAAGSIPNGGMCSSSTQCQSGCCCQDSSGGNQNRCVIRNVGCNNCIGGGGS